MRGAAWLCIGKLMSSSGHMSDSMVLQSVWKRLSRWQTAVLWTLQARSRCNGWLTTTAAGEQPDKQL